MGLGDKTARAASAALSASLSLILKQCDHLYVHKHTIETEGRPDCS